MSSPHRAPLRLAALLVSGVLAAGLAAVAAPEAEGRAGGPLPGPAPRARTMGFDPIEVNRKCEGCHTEIAAEWRGSMHQEAWTDPVFQSAYAIEPIAFCRGCHAPESDPAAAPTRAAQHVGVACTTCHVDGGHVVGTRAREGGAHAVVADARLATRDACASCHQFDFPGAVGMPMQDTVAEHERSRFASTPCQGCHMPEVVGAGGKRHKSHDFSAHEDPAMLRAAVKVGATLAAPEILEVSLEGDRVGHAFPTGDMFRRVEVRASVIDASGAVLREAPPVRLGRRFGDRPRPGGELAFDRVEVGDTRVLPPGAGAARRARLRLGAALAPGERVRWEVAYQRMDHAMAASFGVDQARDETIVASGSLGPTPPHTSARPR